MVVVFIVDPAASLQHIAYRLVNRTGSAVQWSPEDTMLAITCDKCRRRFTPTTEDLHGYLTLGKGRKYALVTCPHCGKGNKVATQRVEQALRFSPVVEPPPAAGSGSGGESQ